MPSDRQDPGAIWQGSAWSNLDQASDKGPSFGADELPSAIQQQAGTFQQETDLPPVNARLAGSPAFEDDPPEIEDDEQPTDMIAQTPLELLKHLAPAILLVAIPLVLASLTCLLVLPNIATGHASLPPGALWPITLVILALALAQGFALYYAGKDQGIWALSALGGLCLFLLLIGFTLFGPIPGTLLLLALIVGMVLLGRHCIHPVPEGYADIIFAQKKYNRTLLPGSNILFPWEEVAEQLNVEEKQWICPVQTIQMSREEDLTLRAVISYQLLPEDAYLAVTQVQQWEQSLRDLFVAALQTTVALFKPEDFLPWPQGVQEHMSTYQPVRGEDDFIGNIERRERINNHLFQSIRDSAALWGVQVNWVKIRDIELIPHSFVKSTTSQLQSTDMPVAAPEPSFVQTAGVSNAIQPIPAPVVQQPKRVEQPALTTPQQATPAPTRPLPKEELLVRVYREVQDGHITDPDAIRTFAAQFEVIAKDPEASKTISFDAARAALNLYDQARKYEEQYHHSGELARPDWNSSLQKK